MDLQLIPSTIVLQKIHQLFNGTNLTSKVSLTLSYLQLLLVTFDENMHLCSTVAPLCKYLKFWDILFVSFLNWDVDQHGNTDPPSRWHTVNSIKVLHNMPIISLFKLFLKNNFYSYLSCNCILVLCVNKVLKLLLVI